MIDYRQEAAELVAVTLGHREPSQEVSEEIKQRLTNHVDAIESRLRSLVERALDEQDDAVENRIANIRKAYDQKTNELHRQRMITAQLLGLCMAAGVPYSHVVTDVDQPNQTEEVKNG